MNRRRIFAGSAAGIAGAAALATPNLASAQPRIRWRCPNSFPKSIDTLYGAAEIVSRRVAEMSEGAFQITVSGPGEVVPGLQILDAVQQGSVECGFTASLFYFGKDPSLAISTTLPMGMPSRAMYAWLNYGGGRDQLKDVFADNGVFAIPAACTGAQMGGWFRKEIKTPDDLRGLKFRIAGLGGSVMAKLGTVPQQIAPSDIYPALERGVIDAAECIGPYDDEKLGFAAGRQILLLPRLPGGRPVQRLHDQPPRLWSNCRPTTNPCWKRPAPRPGTTTVAKYDVLNPPALRKLVAGGTQLRPYPREVMAALYRAAQELIRRARRAERAVQAHPRALGQVPGGTGDSGSASPRTARPNFLAVASAPR